MWGKIKFLVIALVVTAATLNTVQAVPAFEWTVDCRFTNEAGQMNYWVGYIAAQDEPEGGLTYKGNGPAIEMTYPIAGVHQRQVDVLLPEYDSKVTLFQYPDDVSVTITYDTPAPYCGEPADTPDLFTITVYVEGGNYFQWEIFDGFSWNLITGVITPAEFDEAGNEFTRLVLGTDNLNHNPDNYRVTALD